MSRKGLHIDAEAVTAVNLGHKDLSRNTVSKAHTLNSTKLTMELRDEFVTTVGYVLLAVHWELYPCMAWKIKVDLACLCGYLDFWSRL